MAQHTAPEVVRIELDRVRKLKPKHRYLRDAVRTSGRSVHELLNDPFGGWAYLLQALLVPDAKKDEAMTLDKASDLIDGYVESGKTLASLGKALAQSLSAYVHLEQTPTSQEQEADPPPNADSPDTPGPSTD